MMVNYIIEIMKKLQVTELFLMVIVLLSLFCLSSVSAADLNVDGVDAAQDDVQDIDIAVDSDDGLSKDIANFQNDDNSLAGADSSTDGGSPLAVSQSSSEQVSNNVKVSQKSSCYLVLDNDADVENVHIGDYVTWIISVVNLGPDTAKQVKVYDQLPDGLKYVKHTLTKGTFDPKTGIWDIGDLAVSDGEVFLNITTEAISIDEQINKAKVVSETPNLNENQSYEEEEIDVEEYDDEYSESVAKTTGSNHVTANPIFLIVLSLFLVCIASIKSKF